MTKKKEAVTATITFPWTTTPFVMMPGLPLQSGGTLIVDPVPGGVNLCVYDRLGCRAEIGTFGDDALLSLLEALTAARRAARNITPDTKNGEERFCDDHRST